MALFPKKRFEWLEPRAFRRVTSAAAESELRWWVRPLSAIGFGGAMLGMWVLVKLDSKMRPPPFGIALAVALGVGLAVIYVLTWFFRVLPCAILVCDDRLFRIIGNTREEWSFKDVEEYGFRHYGDFRILTLGLKRGRHVLVGLPVEVDFGSLERFLTERGMRRAAATTGQQVPASAEAALAQFDELLHRARSC